MFILYLSYFATGFKNIWSVPKQSESIFKIVKCGFDVLILINVNTNLKLFTFSVCSCYKVICIYG